MNLYPGGWESVRGEELTSLPLRDPRGPRSEEESYAYTSASSGGERRV